MESINGLVASPAYLAQVGEPEHPRELQQLRFVGLAEAGCTVTMFRPHAIGEFPIAQRVQLPTYPETLAAVLAGRGIGALPLELVAAELASGQLVHVLPGWEVIDRDAMEKERTRLPDSLRALSL